jgi:hypothetical protein
LKKEILIIGGYGFLDLNIIHHFHNYFELTIAVKKSSIRPEINLPLKYKIVYTDNDDFFSIFKVKQFDVIINCSVDYGSKSDCNQVFETNVNFPLRIIKCIEKSKTLFICFDTYYTKFQNYNYLKNYINSKIEFKNRCISIRNTKIITLQVEHLYGNFDSPLKFISFVIKNLIKELNLYFLYLYILPYIINFILFIGLLGYLIKSKILLRENRSIYFVFMSLFIYGLLIPGPLNKSQYIMSYYIIIVGFCVFFYQRMLTTVTKKSIQDGY